jgi:2-polyprenyl-6-methoxyphenol hydroxylase-like FAD-dependent oxidoreductase
MGCIGNLGATSSRRGANVAYMPVALIVGAGIGGLAAGIALRRAGWQVRIFERADAPRAVGFGVGLAPNAMAALRQLGVAGTVSPQTVTPTAGEVRHADGRVIRRLVGRVQDVPAADLLSLIMRPALHSALIGALDSGIIEVNSEAADFAIDAGRVRVRLTSGATAIGNLLVGADGFHSVIRAQLHPAEPPARPSGYLALRGESPALDRLNGLHAIWYLGHGIEAGCVQASSNAIYWFVSLFADDFSPGPTDAGSVLRRATSRLDAQFLAIAGATAPGSMRLDELFEREPLANWGDGPVTLLGDAAHPMLPHTGQGAAQALEDAVGLGRVMKGAADPIAALRRYEAVRGRRTRAVVRSGPRIARLTTTRNPIIAAVRNGAIRMIPSAVLATALSRVGADPNRELGES